MIFNFYYAVNFLAVLLKYLLITKPFNSDEQKHDASSTKMPMSHHYPDTYQMITHIKNERSAKVFYNDPI